MTTLRAPRRPHAARKVQHRETPQKSFWLPGDSSDSPWAVPNKVHSEELEARSSSAVPSSGSVTANPRSRFLPHSELTEAHVRALTWIVMERPQMIEQDDLEELIRLLGHRSTMEQAEPKGPPLLPGVAAFLHARTHASPTWIWRWGTAVIIAVLAFSAVGHMFTPLLGLLGLSVAVVMFGLVGVVDFAVRGTPAQNPRISVLLIVIGVINVAVVIASFVFD